MSEDRDINTAEMNDTEQIRRHQPRAPRRRGNNLSSEDMVHISESLEESISVYEHNAPNRYSAGHVQGAAYKGAYEGIGSQGYAYNYDAKPHIESKESYADDYDDSEDFEAKPHNKRQGRRSGRLTGNEKKRSGKAETHVSDNAPKRSRNDKNQSYAADEYAAYDGDQNNDVYTGNMQQRIVGDDRQAYDADDYNGQSGNYGGNINTHPEPAGGNGKKEKKKKKHPVLKLMLLLFICAAAFIGYKFITGQSGYYTVAVFGVDSRNGNVGKDALSDVNIIARVDRASGEIKLVSLYRDTYTKINSDGKYHKLNEAYFKGGPDQAIWAVEHNTDVKIDDYATFNWKAVADAINILGGVDLEITDKEFKYINAFITETVNSTGVGSVQLEHAGMNHLDGVQAVAYARLRLMDTDYQRTERQRKVIGLALDKAKNADYKTLATIIATVMPEISTSITPDDLIPFARGIDRYYISETAGFPFDKQGMKIGKMDCVIPVTLESNAIQLHEFLYPDTPYTPSAELKSISDKIINVTGLTG